MLDPIRHVVVLMLENRSFDNILGGLYGSGWPSVFVPPSNTDPVDGIVLAPDGEHAGEQGEQENLVP